MLCTFPIILLISIPESHTKGKCAIFTLVILILLMIFRSALNTLKCLALGIQYRCLDIDGNSSQGRFRKYEKLLEKKTKRTKSKSSEEDRKQQDKIR